MTSTQISPSRDELQQLRAQVAAMAARLEELDGRTDKPSRARRPWRRRARLIATLTCTGLVVTGVAGAAPTTSTTDVAFVPLTVGHKVLSNVTIGINKTNSPVVAGGSTTVPTNATAVRLTVTAKGTKAGMLNFYPAGNASAGSGQSLSYPAGNVTVSATIEENIGQSDQLTFANSGAGSAIVNATLTGYSTQVTAGDINGVGGSNDQVLTNNGAGGAIWRDLDAAQLGGAAGSAGQNLTNNGAGGASWQTQGQAFEKETWCCTSLPTSYLRQTIASLTVPAGSYLVHADVLAEGASNRYFCYIVPHPGYQSQDGLAQTDSSTAWVEFGVQHLISTSGGTIELQCGQYNTSGAIYEASLIATQVNSVSGDVSSAANTATVPPH